MPTSEDHDDQSALAQNGIDTASRKSSITTQLTSQTHESSPETTLTNATAQLESLSPSLSELEPLDYQNVIDLGSTLAEDPDSARRWLVDFGYLKEGTHVSLRFRCVTGSTKHVGPQSVLPLLSAWIPEWYRLAVNRRKTDKLPKTSSYKEQDDFDWLLTYVADYVHLGHESFDEDELAQLCVSLTQVCQETGRQSVINDSIMILHSIMSETILPRKALSPTLEVHCAGTVTLPNSPEELDENVKLLLTGPLQNDATRWLFDCITTPNIQNNSFRLIDARGAIRQVQKHIDLLDKSGSYAISLEEFLNCLNQASKCCIFRFCTEVLMACERILRSKQLQNFLSSDMRSFIGTIENCTRTVLPRNGSGRSLDALRSPDRAQILESQKQNDKYLAERKNVMKQLLSAFESAWDQLTDLQARLVGDLFMDSAKDLTDTQAAAVISHLSARGLLLPDADDWSQRGTKVFDCFVRNTRLSSPQRIDSALLCINAAEKALHPLRNTSEMSESRIATGKNIIDRLLNMLGKELNTAIVKAVLDPMKYLTDCADGHGKPHYASLILGKLLYFVKTEREGEDEVSDEHVLFFTQTIRDIFLRALHKNGTVAVQAYDALLEIASAKCRSRRCRLAALRILLRIRCDVDGMIFIETGFESEYIAEALCRTEATREAYAKELATSQRSSASHITGTAHNANARQLWVYPKEASCMHDWDTKTSTTVVAPGLKETSEGFAELNVTSWLVTVIESLQADNDWETYSFIIVHLGAQLFNTKLFCTSLQAVVMLRQILCDQIHNNSFKEPPANTGLKRSDTALCMFNMLTSLIPYASMKSDKIQKGFGDDLVRSFVTGIGNTWDGTHRGCIHALSVCSYEIPASVASSYPSIVQTMGKNMSQSHLTIHILEFLTQVARLPEVHSSFNQNEITQIFGICLQFLEKTREMQNSNTSTSSPRSGTPARHSGLNLRRPPYRAAILQDTALPQYAAALAYNTMIFWFLSLRLEVRAQYVSWIVPRLVWKNARGEEVIEEQSQVFIDMMQRTAFSDIGESAPNQTFAKDSDGTVSSASWIVGLSIITAETAGHTGLTQITKRQAAGTTYSLYQQLTTSTPSHHIPLHTQFRPEEVSRFGTTDMLPSHILLQMVSTAAPTSVEDHPIYLPHEDYVTRALNVFDRIPTIDNHKIGVLYVGPGQSHEAEYLANTTTSPAFERFLYGLGYRVSLEPPLRFNPQGLQFPRDGEATMAWRDRICEIVYHIPSMMPNNLDDDPSCTLKKSHVGNCHVVIVFNESGLPWKLDNFSSAVTFVNVVITPVNRAAVSSETHTAKDHVEEMSQETVSVTTTTDNGPSDFYQVVVVTKENYPNVSPAADPKVVSREMLPGFIRMFSINANIFSNSKVAADSNDDEWPSTWRARLQAIKRLKERVIGKTGLPSRNHSVASGGTEPSKSTMVSGSITSGRKTPILREDVHGVEGDGALALQLDFGRWTSPSEKD